MNIIKTLFAVKSLSKTIQTQSSKLLEVAVNDEASYVTTFNEIFKGALQTIEESPLDRDYKQGFKNGFMRTMYKRLNSQFPSMSGNDLMRMFGWEQKLYNEILNAVVSK